MSVESSSPVPVLVIGGAGYIGAHIASVMAARGYLPVVYDNLSQGKREFVQWGPLVEGSTANADAIRSAVNTHGIKAAICLAAFIEVGESVRDPLKYYENNVANIITAARALQGCGLRGLVFSSTAAVYGEPRQIPIPEDHPLLPVSPYGASKLMAERIFADAHAAGGFPCVPLRYFNACGADPQGRIGEAHDPETHLIPRACLAALNEVPPLQVFGTDFDTPDGTALRDYIHVCDLAEAHVLALDYLLRGGAPRPFNLGLGHGVSVMEIIRAVERVAQRAVPFDLAARRAGDPARLIAQAADAGRVLGWTPKFTDLDAIVATAWRWYASRSVPPGSHGSQR
jgi:UDP-arabinose 4-epimerase